MLGPMTNRTIHISLPEEVHDFLRDLAHDERRSMAYLVRDAIRTHYRLDPMFGVGSELPDGSHIAYSGQS